MACGILSFACCSTLTWRALLYRFFLVLVLHCQSQCFLFICLLSLLYSCSDCLDTATGLACVPKAPSEGGDFSCQYCFGIVNDYEYWRYWVVRSSRSYCLFQMLWLLVCGADYRRVQLRTISQTDRSEEKPMNAVESIIHLVALQCAT